jgi:Uma2 family endonuclease
MSALTVGHDPWHGPGWDEAVRLWEETDAPEGSKVEIIEGIVTVAPPPANAHNLTAARMQRLLYEVIPPDWEIVQTQGLSVPTAAGLYIPDLAVLPREALERPGNRVAAGEARLVVEITSQGNANHDRIHKAHGYAQAGVPLYLLLDPWHAGRPTATLYGEPEKDTYRVLDSAEYGGIVRLPVPFDLAVDTGVLPEG